MRVYLAGGYTVMNVKGRERVESKMEGLESFIFLLFYELYY